MCILASSKGKGGATLASPRPGQGEEGIQSASTGPVPWVSLHPTPSLPDTVGPAHNPRHNPHSVDVYVFRNTKQRGEGEGVKGLCAVGQNLHPAYL